NIAALDAQTLRAERRQPTVEAHRELTIAKQALFAQDESDVVERNLRIEAAQHGASDRLLVLSRNCTIRRGVDLGDTLHEPDDVGALGDGGREEPATLQVAADDWIAQGAEPKE